ncbi:hypothetical protein BpHYR1_021942 [Brachionus plicatilis]|uniref:Uncharacterized protein n=1 Tax=Brachionus plicatilis TaxID=10195 RepID=A0A3M7RRC4_BRAPC|nr:hypothetical protein BpHYR1_021942 [Brachionus plicatilis]
MNTSKIMICGENQKKIHSAFLVKLQNHSSKEYLKTLKINTKERPNLLNITFMLNREHKA